MLEGPLRAETARGPYLGLIRTKTPLVLDQLLLCKTGLMPVLGRVCPELAEGPGRTEGAWFLKPLLAKR